MGKYDELAAGFTEREYGDPKRYFGRRTQLVVSLGPALEEGDTVLDFACADASAGPPLLERGIRYLGVDASAEMIAVARRRVPDAEFLQADMFSFAPPEPVEATTIFRALHVIPDRVAFFRHVASFTRKKYVFDFSPRRYDSKVLRRELATAGFTQAIVRPFLVPQRTKLPGAVAAALERIETVPGAANAVLHFRCTAICVAHRDGV